MRCVLCRAELLLLCPAPACSPPLPSIPHPPPHNTQRTALVKYHDYELRLTDGEGDWQLREIHATRKAGASPAKAAPRVEEVSAEGEEAP